MKLLFIMVFISTILMLTTSNPFQNADKWINIVNNNPHSTWKAGCNFNPNLPESYIKSLLGTKKLSSNTTLPVREMTTAILNGKIPKSFDARTKWPHCKSLHEIRDQGDCGSCWAVAASSAFSDRLCIATQGKVNVHLSQEELTTCCSQCGSGCNGGYPEIAWHYFKSHGLVTGGDYGSQDGCQPYQLKPCEHHVEGERPSCPSLDPVKTPSCKKTCTNKKYTTSFSRDHRKVKEAYYVKSNVKIIQKEILQHGPVVAGFTVYDDFFHYKSGVYKVSSGATAKGGHAVKVIGWGVENGVKYWLVQNSWNNDWGDKGLFKIVRGTNECGFESSISAGIPNV